MFVILLVLLAQFHQYMLPCQLQQYIGGTEYFEYNGAAVLAAPIIAQTDMFTMCNVYSFSAFL
jgi:hypothetical protein